MGSIIQAYIDPGSSSYIFQLLIAGFMGVVFFFTTLKQKFLGLFRKTAEPAKDKAEVPAANSSKDASGVEAKG